MDNKTLETLSRIKNFIDLNSRFTVIGISREGQREDKEIIRIDMMPTFHIHIAISDFYNITEKNLADILKLIEEKEIE